MYSFVDAHLLCILIHKIKFTTIHLYILIPRPSQGLAGSSTTGASLELDSLTAGHAALCTLVTGHRLSSMHTSKVNHTSV